MAAYQSGPRCMMGGSAARVSTLLMSVGQPYRPATAGKGGFSRGWPRLPSRLSSSAVSSPQMYAPAPRYSVMSNGLPGPSASGPSLPASRASVMAAASTSPCTPYSPRM